MGTSIDLNILTLGSYDILIGLDSLESHKTIINSLHKSFDFIDEERKYHTIKWIYRPTSTRKILGVQLKKCVRKGCQLYGIKIV